MKFFLGVVATLAALVILAVVIMFTGAYNVAATDDHNALVRWALATTRVNAVRARSEDIAVPPGLDAPSRVAAGARAYDRMCVACHGAPGVEAFGFSEHMKPQPPEMTKVAEFFEPQDIQWILLNGFKMTGMPAWGAIADDEELWAVTAFVEAYPDMTAERYAEMTARADSGGGQAGDGAADGGDENSGAAAGE